VVKDILYIRILATCYNLLEMKHELQRVFVHIHYYM